MFKDYSIHLFKIHLLRACSGHRLSREQGEKEPLRTVWALSVRLPGPSWGELWGSGIPDRHGPGLPLTEGLQCGLWT